MAEAKTGAKAAPRVAKAAKAAPKKAAPNDAEAIGAANAANVKGPKHTCVLRSHAAAARHESAMW